MKKYKINESIEVSFWKDIIISNLLTQYKNGLSIDIFNDIYKKANKIIIKKCFDELEKEGKVIIVK